MDLKRLKQDLMLVEMQEKHQNYLLNSSRMLLKGKAVPVEVLTQTSLPVFTLQNSLEGRGY